MQRKSTLLIPLVLILGMAGFVLFKNKTTVTTAPPETSPTSAVKSQKLMDQVKDFPGLPKAKLSELEKTSVCKDTLESIETLPFKTLIYDLENGNLKFDPQCPSLNVSSPSLEGFPEACLKLENDKPSPQCQEKLLLFKALRIHQATVGENLDGLPTEALINKLVGLLIEDKLNSEEGQKALHDVGLKLYERLPDSASAAKAAAIAYLSESEQASPDSQKKLEKVLEDSRTKFPEDWELYEIDLARRSRQSIDDFEAEVRRFYAAYPNSAVGNYYMGCISWINKDAVQARSFFKIATERAPKDQRMQGTLTDAIANEPPAKVCGVSISFNPENF